MSTKPERTVSETRHRPVLPPAAEWLELEQRELVGRIVVSPTFARSERLSSLLTYVCDMTLKGRQAEINEQKIGHAVFGRSPDYDSSADGIVRTQASRLRHRLDLYFQQEGAGESLRVMIPRGGYVPLFQPKTAAVETPDAEAAPSLPATPGDTVADVHTIPDSKRRWSFRFLVILLLTATAALLATNLVLERGRLLNRFWGFVHPSPSQKLWRTMFAPGQPTLLVMGDAGANMFENIARRTITPDEYSSDSWAADPVAQTPPGYNWVPITRRTYTPLFGVRFAAKIARRPEVSDGQLSVRIARSVRLDELKDSQAILLGGANYDPWEELFSANRNFHYLYDPVENSVSIRNEHPESGEPTVYKWKQSDANPVAGYSLITLTHNLSGTGRVFLLQGTTAQGDEVAADFVMDEARFNPLLARAIGKDGRLQDFEAVLETKFVGGGSVGATVAAFRLHPAGH